MGGGAGTVKTADYLERRYMAEETASPKYRHEDKYLCDSMQNAVLKARAGAILKRDGHTAQEAMRNLIREMKSGICILIRFTIAVTMRTRT